MVVGMLLWTVNLKSFEMCFIAVKYIVCWMNCKLEKFWNVDKDVVDLFINLWTVNLKSFEIGNKSTTCKINNLNEL